MRNSRKRFNKAKKGKVYLIGAGPGDSGLITEKGVQILHRADTILYDDLANPSLLLHARGDAKKIRVGKAKRTERVSQAKINRVLVREALLGRTVVRLKGGDPILFSRGAEEALHLAAEGIPFEIIPGVSAALAVPAGAGIPLTIRGVSSSVTILTGHEAEGKGKAGVDWGRLLGADSTFVVLMGVKNLEKLVERFLAAGKNPSLRAALIERGTTSRQRIVAAPLSRIAVLARKKRIHPPAILVVGEVVALRRRLARSKRLPLSGARVLVTRPSNLEKNIVQLLEEKGAVPVVCPLIEIKPPRSFASLDRQLRNLEKFDWVIFTSANGVRSFMERLGFIGMDARALAHTKICAIGPATSAALKRSGLKADCIPRKFSSRGVLQALYSRKAIKGRTFLLARSDRASRIIPEGLSKRGGRVTEVITYRTARASRNNRTIRDLICNGSNDVVLLTSPSIAEAYAEIREACSEKMKRLPLYACLGPETAGAARKVGLQIAIVAQRYTDEGLVNAVVRLWKRQGSR
jgi:uroporphyrinogen III methyltransferase/synthase